MNIAPLLHPFEAVQAQRDVRARQSLGIHWGTLANLADEDLDEPPRKLAEPNTLELTCAPNARETAT